MSSIINKFNIFSEIDHNLANNIKLFYFNKFDLLFATIDNSVYHYNARDKRLKKFDAFCENQVIIKFDCSYHYMYAHNMSLIDNGCVYSWGHNILGQLGDAKHVICDKPKLINGLSDVFIIDISCGLNHSLVLARDGAVYAFGLNFYGQCGNNSIDDQLIPIKVNILNTTKVVAVSCGYWHSIALTESGHVFGWGRNTVRPLGNHCSDIQRIPIQLSVPLIKQIMCGNWYTLMLSTDGDIYFCGEIEDCLSHVMPTKLNSSTKFIEIAATIHSQLCVVLSHDNRCFIFGKYGDEENEVTIKDLRATDFSSISETFAFYQQITYKSIATNIDG